MKMKKISIIIPSRPDENIYTTLQSIRESDYPKELIEIFHVTGNEPSRQRNACVRRASGDIIYFLDNDSCVMPYTIRRMINKINQYPTAIIGGPSLTPKTDSPFQQLIGIVLSSFIGSGKYRARYAQIGTVRFTDQTEIILCNMMIPRKIFTALHGFNIHLYPNEENDLIARHQHNHGLVLYLPDAPIIRSQRRTLKDFIKQIFTYGKGRGEQTIINPSSITIFPLIAVGFIIYCCVLLICLFSQNMLNPELHNFVKILSIPLFLYFVIIGPLAWVVSSNHTQYGFSICTPIITTLLFFLNHVLYGLGFLFGIIHKNKKNTTSKNTTIKIHHITAWKKTFRV